jgi:predicted DNA-binding protein with PD1-like motif
MCSSPYDRRWWTWAFGTPRYSPASVRSTATTFTSSRRRLVVNGEVHAHITFSNTELAMGGHLEEGCRVLTFAVVVMAEAVDVDLTGWDRPGALG